MEYKASENALSGFDRYLAKRFSVPGKDLICIPGCAQEATIEFEAGPIMLDVQGQPKEFKMVHVYANLMQLFVRFTPEGEDIEIEYPLIIGASSKINMSD